MMLSSEGINMVLESYPRQAEMLKNYVSADSSVIFTSVLIGIAACKAVYDLTHLMSAVHLKIYTSFPRSRQIEWSNRAMSTFHAVFITTASLYFIFFSNLFSDDLSRGPITLRSSTMSTCALGVSLGYFLSDISMIIWFFPALGGMEYVVHHLLALVSVTYAMLTGEAQYYAFFVLTSEATTPGINLRWYLDAAGMKKSRVYIVNGVLMFLTWLVARILLFIYLFYHAYRYYDQVMQLQLTGLIMIFIVPAVLSVMNLIWFWKIIKGLNKTLAKRH